VATPESGNQQEKENSMTTDLEQIGFSAAYSILWKLNNGEYRDHRDGSATVYAEFHGQGEYPAGILSAVVSRGEPVRLSVAATFWRDRPDGTPTTEADRLAVSRAIEEQLHAIGIEWRDAATA